MEVKFTWDGGITEATADSRESALPPFEEPQIGSQRNLIKANFRALVRRVVGMKKDEDVSEEKTSHQRNPQRYFITLHVQRIKR